MFLAFLIILILSFNFILFYKYKANEVTLVGSYRMKFQDFVKKFGNVSNPNNKIEYNDAILEPQCRRNHKIIRDFDKEPVIITVSPHTRQTYFLHWVMKDKEDVGHLKTCDVNCIYHRKLTKENIYQTDAFLTFLETEPLKKRCFHQKNIFFSQESWVKFKSGFDIIASTSPKSDIYTMYSGYDLSRQPVKKTSKSLASAFISNCYNRVTSNRNYIYKKILDYGVTVDSFGKCHQNAFIPKELENVEKHERKLRIMQNYKFYLAFENSIHDGYITEKYWQALHVGTIPIYLGAGDISKYEPLPGSIIKISDFKTMAELAKHIFRISENETLYNQMLEWKRIGPSDDFLARIDTQCGNDYCKFCYKVADTFVNPVEFIDKDFTVLFIRERMTFRYQTIKLITKTIKELKDKIQEAFKGYSPLWVDCATKSLRMLRNYKMNPPPINIYRIILSGLRFQEMFEGPSIQSDEDVKQLKSGTRLEIILI